MAFRWYVVQTYSNYEKRVQAAVKEIGFRGLIAYGEFWHPQKTPNLLIEISKNDVKILTHALSQHKGEITRNPYHLRLPAWLMDNVRRGSEVLSGMGKVANHFPFGVIYQVVAAKKGKLTKTKLPFTTASKSYDLSEMIIK